VTSAKARARSEGECHYYAPVLAPPGHAGALRSMSLTRAEPEATAQHEQRRTAWHGTAQVPSLDDPRRSAMHDTTKSAGYGDSDTRH